MHEQTYFLSFARASASEANCYAEELREALLDAEASLAVQRQRENPLAQDLGSSLVLIMGAPAVVTAVQAIGHWLQKRRSDSLTIVTAEKAYRYVSCFEPQSSLRFVKLQVPGISSEARSSSSI